MRLKKVILTMVATIIPFNLVGCSDSTDTVRIDEPYTPPDRNVSATISYAFWDQNQRVAMEECVKAFNSIYPNIKVKLNLTPFAQYWTKLKAQAESNSLPDIFWMNAPNVALYAKNMMITSVQPLVDAKQIDLDNYYKSLNDLYTYNGSQYGIAKDYDTVAVFYNKAIFKKAGVPLPKSPWTWDDYHNTAKQISDRLKSDGIYGDSTGREGGQEGYYDTIFQAGGMVLSDDKKSAHFSSPEGIRGLRFWNDMIIDGSSPTVEQLSDTDPKRWLESGKSAMFWGGSWNVSALQKSPIKSDIGIIELPREQRSATVIHGVANVVNARSKHKQVASAFQVFLSSRTAAEIQARLRTAIPSYKGTQQAFVDASPGWDVGLFVKEATDYSYPYPVSLRTQKWTDVVEKSLLEAFSGRRALEDVAKDIDIKVNRILQQE